MHGVDNVGTVPASLTAFLAIQTLKPDVVISIGTAGGFKAKGGEIGDVYVATAFANHDRHIPIPVRFFCSGMEAHVIWCKILLQNSALGPAFMYLLKACSRFRFKCCCMCSTVVPLLNV